MDDPPSPQTYGTPHAQKIEPRFSCAQFLNPAVLLRLALLKCASPNPRGNFRFNGKVRLAAILEARPQRVRVDLQRDPVVAAAGKKSANVQFREAAYAELAILLCVHQLMEKHSRGARFVRNANTSQSH